MSSDIMDEWYKDELDAVRKMSEADRAELGRKIDMMFQCKTVEISDGAYMMDEAVVE